MINRKHKDTLFRDLFGTEENKGNALELYNALNGSSYDNVDDLSLTTLDDTIFIGMRNDVSFLLRQEMVLFEHQSTRSCNMPLRGLLYMRELYTELIGDDRRVLYRETPIMLPTPRFYVLYNGVEDMPDREEMRFSECMTGGPGDLEVVAHVINVNEGRNRAIMGASKALAGYAHLVALIRSYGRTMPLEQAVTHAVERCIEEGVLVEYLKSRRGTLNDMLFQEYDEELARQVAREDGYAEGRAEERERLKLRLREAGVDEDLIRRALDDA